MRKLLPGALLCCLIVAAVPVASRANDVEQHLRDQYQGKILLLRGLPEGDSLAYDSNGVLATTGREGDWTSSGIVRITGIKITRNQLKVDANRIHADPTDDGFQLTSERRVRIIADLGVGPASVEKAEALFSNIFLTAHDDFAETVQDYWKPCVFAGLSGNPSQAYRACKFSSDFLKIPGVVKHPDYKSDPKDLPPSIAKSLNYEVLSVGKATTTPRRISGDEPPFTEEARKARYNGEALLGLVIGPTGAVEKIWVISPAPYGLTLSALQSVAAWKFQPAIKDARPVAVQVTVETSFRIYK